MLGIRYIGMKIIYSKDMLPLSTFNANASTFYGEHSSAGGPTFDTLPVSVFFVPNVDSKFSMLEIPCSF